MISVLDDDPSQAECICQTLSKAGHMCHSFSEGNAFVHPLLRQIFDLLVLDWSVSDMPGDEVLKWTRQNLPPMLFIASRSYETDIVSMLNAGAGRLHREAGVRANPAGMRRNAAASRVSAAGVGLARAVRRLYVRQRCSYFAISRDRCRDRTFLSGALRATRRADDIEVYRVQSKDTLYGIAERYLIRSGNWKVL
ncbi:response regulator [Mycetohabitans endofungorum]|uniref:response regulator n=1 Tax=Mycetohabitans endofungorum TaxID=417203 RepID=UPI002B057FA5|nr:response regulator [Mycetohabitans endofungorum]